MAPPAPPADDDFDMNTAVPVYAHAAHAVRADDSDDFDMSTAKPTYAHPPSPEEEDAGDAFTEGGAQAIASRKGTPNTPATTGAAVSYLGNELLQAPLDMGRAALGPVAAGAGYIAGGLSDVPGVTAKGGAEAASAPFALQSETGKALGGAAGAVTGTVTHPIGHAVDDALWAIAQDPPAAVGLIPHGKDWMALPPDERYEELKKAQEGTSIIGNAILATVGLKAGAAGAARAVEESGTTSTISNFGRGEAPARPGPVGPAEAPPSIHEVLGPKYDKAPAAAAADAGTPVARSATPAPVEAPPDISNPEGRADVLREVGFTDDHEVRKSALSNDRMDGATDHQLTKSDTKQGREAGDIFDTERLTLDNYAGKLEEQAGGTSDIIDSGARYARGKTMAGAVQAGYDNLNDSIKQLYQEADKRANGVPQPLNGLSDLMTNERSSFIQTQEGTSLLRGLQQRIKEMGLNAKDGSIRPATPLQAERLRQFIGDGYTPKTGRLITKLQDTIDDDVTKNVGEDLYGTSRALRRQRDQLYDKPDAVSNLLDPKPGEARTWAHEDVPAKLVNQPVDELKKFVDVMNSQRKKAKLEAGAEAALNELRGQFAKMIRNAGKGVGTASKKYQWNSADVEKVLNANRERMRLVFTPAEMRQFELLDKAGQVFDVDRGFKGSLVEGHNIAQRGVNFALEHGPALIGGTFGHGLGAVAGEMVGKRLHAKLNAPKSIKTIRLGDVKNPPRAPAPTPKMTSAPRAQRPAPAVTNALPPNPLSLYGASGPNPGEQA